MWTEGHGGSLREGSDLLSVWVLAIRAPLGQLPRTYLGLACLRQKNRTSALDAGKSMTTVPFLET